MPNTFNPVHIVYKPLVVEDFLMEDDAKPSVENNEYPTIYIVTTFVTYNSGLKQHYDNRTYTDIHKAIKLYQDKISMYEEQGVELDMKQVVVSVISYNPNNSVPFVELKETVICKKKNKVYLNGPKKDNEFLKKKGKHYA